LAKVRSSVLDWFLIAIKKGKAISKVSTFDIPNKKVETTTGDTLDVDYFVARKSPSPFLDMEIQELGIESTDDLQAYIQKKEKENE